MERNGRPVSVIGVFPRSVPLRKTAAPAGVDLTVRRPVPAGVRMDGCTAGRATPPAEGFTFAVSGGAAGLAAGLAVAVGVPPRAGSTAAAAGGGADEGACAGGRAG